MKMPCEDSLSKESKRIIARYEKSVIRTITSVDELIADVNVRMKTIRTYGNTSYALCSEEKRDEAYAFVRHTRDDIGFMFDQKIEQIRQYIKEIEDGIEMLQTSNRIKSLITDFEKTVIIESLVRCINYLRASQSMIDGSRVMLFNYTETILQSIGKGSTYLTYRYDTPTKKMYTLIGHPVENTSERLAVDDLDSEENDEQNSLIWYDPKNKKTTDSRIVCCLFLI